MCATNQCLCACALVPVVCLCLLRRVAFVCFGVACCGAAVVVVEELEHALARGAKIYAEVVGYGATSDGYDMVAPSGKGWSRESFGN